MDPQSENTIAVTSKEGDIYSLPKTSATMSKLLKGAIDDFNGDINVPLADMDKITTQKVIEYLNHYNGVTPPEIDKPLRSANMKENTDEFSANFVDALSLEELEQVTLAANFMEIQPLLDLCCAKYVAMVKDKSEEELMKEFGITTPFTEEEKQKIKEENPWLEEGPDSMK
jgi:S-phase kinase-associated protein 1